MIITFRPIVIFIGIAFTVFILKALVELLIRRTPHQKGDSFWRRLLLYPTELALIPATGSTSQIFGVPFSASETRITEKKQLMPLSV